MAKGNRIVNLYKDDVWKSVFFESVGTYVNVINNELSQEYPLVPLSDYIKIGGGYAFKTSEYKKSGIPIIRISDFNNEQIDISNCVYYDEDVSLSKYELKENDIIICLTGGTIAKLGIVQAGLGKLYMNQRVGRFDILDNSKFEKEYVYWIARSVQSIIKNLAWGAAIPNVSPKQIEKLKFSFPPIEVQRQIIEFLNDLKNNTIQNKVYFNESIERHIIELQNNNVALKDVNSELTHQLDLIKQLRQAFLREAMQGKLCHAELVSASQETGHELLAKIKATLRQAQGGKKGKKEKELPLITEDEIPFEIPEHWTWCKIGDITTSIVPNRDKPQTFSGDIKWITQSNFSEKSFKLNYDLNTLGFTKEEIVKYNCRVMPKGSIIMSCVGRFDLVCLIEREIVANQQLHCFVPNDDIIPMYLAYAVKLFSKYVEKDAIHTTIKYINKTKCESIPIPLPPLHEQAQIVAKLEELMAFCDGLEQSIKESQGYNEKLLQQVLREALQPKAVV